MLSSSFAEPITITSSGSASFDGTVPDAQLVHSWSEEPAFGQAEKLRHGSREDLSSAWTVGIFSDDEEEPEKEKGGMFIG